MKRRVEVFDTTLRDGEQAPGFSMTVSEKVRVAAQLEKLGVDIIEAGFPIASAGEQEAVRRIAQQCKTSGVAALCRAKKQDIDAAWEALKYAVRPRFHIFLATSDIHLEHKLRITREEAIQQAVAAVKYARSFGAEVEFSPEDATRSDEGFLIQILEAVIDAGVTVINIADTVGYAIPSEFRRLIRLLRSEVPNADKAKFSVHCHNDLGMAVANTLAGIEAGADQVECTINGIGERAGNAALEEVIMALHVRNSVFNVETGIRTEEIYPTSKLVQEITGVHVQPNKAVVGANAFAHEAGIHQHGVLSHSSTYEIMTPESIGLPSNRLVLGKHSGRHALQKTLQQMGIWVDREDLNRIYRR
ncbi:MAG: 2-isopropylmalate synthase, partial [Calditrichaeota bacterium]|nr:2-isopropylmalate synthase [Calditrichota bacterium]